ncbi:MAG: helicase-related protein [Pseudomonadota bacterium]
MPARHDPGAADRATLGGVIPDTPAKNDNVVAVLGPTNTGKTHYAIERMLAHQTGVIGFPLRLLAREVYDRIVALRGPREVALITGEEKITPPQARFYICTVESMPIDWGADFLAVDEIQLCADPERGHVFTHRLLHARGAKETLFLGSRTMWDRIEALVPGARFMSRDRMSTLVHSGSKKIARLPERSAIVAFSVDNVYAIAELLRRQKGGAAVVMGALSPRTRNAQVALYQDGDVDYLVATDAIGMGLNLDVRHVAFAGLRKFDGRRMRDLRPNELAQIAGRAGRHTNDGTFGVTGEAPPLDEDVAYAIENHRFDPVTKLQWRNARLEFASADSLMRSLEREAPHGDLTRARDADDVIVLRHLARDPDIGAMATGRAGVRLLWDVCQVPDFRKTLASEHAALLNQLYRFIAGGDGVIPNEWMTTQCQRLDREDGDIDALSKRLAYIRTWTYVANRSNWVDDPGYWRDRTREIEDRVSDALHARLTQRFVDRRTSVLMRRLKQKESLVAEIDDTGSVSVEGEFVGRLEGFRFQPDPNAAGAEVRTLQTASAQALQSELSRRVEKFYTSPDTEIDVTEQGGLMWGDAAVGRLEPSDDPLSPKALAFADEMLDAPLQEKIARRLQFWIDSKIKSAFEPLLKLKNDEAVTGLARGVAFQLVENFGVIPRQHIAGDIKALDQDARGLLRKNGVRFGQYSIFMPLLLKPAPTRFRLLLWGLRGKLDIIPSPPPPGHVTIPTDAEAPDGYDAMAGYRNCGPRAVRIDMLERLADMIRPMDVRGGFEATPDMLSITGATLEQFSELMEGLGFSAEKGERPKAAKPPREPSKPEAETADQDPDVETPVSAEAATEGGDPSAPKPDPEPETSPAEPGQGGSSESERTIDPSPEPAPAPAHVPDANPYEPGTHEPGTHEAGTHEAGAHEAGEEKAQTPAAADAAETTEAAQALEVETYYTFRLTARGRRAKGETRDERQGARGRAAGEDQNGGRHKHGKGRPQGDRRGGKPSGKGKPGKGGPGKGGAGQKPREFSAAPKREKRADPDSPFAVLQQLKEKS